MTSPILPLAHAITQDRIRDAENARLARSVAQEPVQQPQRRRLRRLASRVALSLSALR